MSAHLVIVNTIAIIFLSINLFQVAYALYKKQTLACACMGNLGFDLPLSYVTIIEDVVMIFMAFSLLFAQGH